MVHESSVDCFRPKIAALWRIRGTVRPATHFFAALQAMTLVWWKREGRSESEVEKPRLSATKLMESSYPEFEVTWLSTGLVMAVGILAVLSYLYIGNVGLQCAAVLKGANECGGFWQ